MGKKQSTKEIAPPSQDFLANQALIKGLSKEGIKEGNIINPEVVKASAEVVPTEYQGIEKDYAPLPYKYFDKYESYIDPGTLRGGQFDVGELSTLRANNQSNWEQLGNATGRVALNIVPQIIGGFASMADLPGYFDAEHAATNSIVNWADGIKKTVDEDWLPIYEDSPNKSMQLGDWAWWMSRGSGLVESVGSFLAQGAGVGKLVSAGAKGLGTLSKARNLAKAVTGLEIGAETGLKTANALGTVTSAVMLNQSEAVIEATQVYNTTLQKALDRNEPYEDAKLKASKAAATTMNINRLNIALNLTSAKAFMNPRMYTRQLLEKGTLGATLGTLAAEGGQEAMEELINHVASKKGLAVGEDRKYNWDDAVKDITSMEGMEAAFLGAIGGIAQTGGTKALQYSKYGPGSTTDEGGNRISLKTKQRNDYDKQQEIIKEMEASGVKMTDTMQNLKDRILFEEKVRKAAETGNEAELETLFNQRFEKQAIKSFQSGTTQILEDLYKTEAKQDPNEVGQEHIDRANENIQNLKALEEVYNNYESYNNVEDILMNRANKMRANRAYSEADTLKKNSDVDLGLQVREIAKKYNYEHDQEYIDKEEGVEVARGTRKITSPLTYSMSNLEENTGTTDSNRATYNSFLQEVESLPSYQASKQYEGQIDTLNKLRIEQDKELGKLTSPKYQEEVAIQKAEKQKVKDLKTAVNSAQSISEVEKLKEQSKDEDFTRIANAKIEALKTVAAEEAKAKKVNLIVAQTKEKINNLTLEDETNISQEIEDLEIAENQKQLLREALYNHVNKLNGVPVEEDLNESEDPFSAFAQGSEEEQEIANKEEESFATEIPKDLPNPNTEAETVEQEVANNAKSLVQSDTTTIEGQDAQGNLIYNYDKASEGYNRGAFLSREFNQTDDQGVINREEFTDKVEDNLDILDPDKYNEGEELTLDIDFSYEGEKYDPNSTTREKISWLTRSAELNQLAKERGVQIYELPEYIAEVPIVVKAKDGTPIFYVHDNAWYKAENLNATAEEIAEDKARNFKIREHIVKNGITKSNINYKSYGKLFKTADGKKLSLSEAMPDPNLIIAIGKNGTYDANKSLPIETINGKSVSPRIIGNAPIQEGRPYALVRVGKGVYMPIPVQRSPISQEVANTIIFAIEAYLTNDPNNQTVKNIYDATGYNINEITGLKMYLNQFIYLYPVKNEIEFENILIQGGQGGTLKSNMPLIAFTGNSIMFGKPGVNMGIKTNKKAGVISKNFDSSLGIKKLKEVILDSGKVLSSVSISDLQLNKNTALILNKEGDTQTVKYLEHIKASTETNTLSVNIGTEQEPKWVYTIQPTVLFDTSFAGIDSTQKLRAFKPTQKVASVTSTTTTTTTDTKADIERTRQEELEALPFDEQTKQRLEFAKTKGEERYLRQLKLEASKIPSTTSTVSGKTVMIPSGSDIMEKHDAEDVLANPNSDIVSRIMAVQKLADIFKPYNEATKSDILKDIARIEAGDISSDRVREVKKIYEAELAALEQPTTQQQTAEQEVERLRAAEQVENAEIERKRKISLISDQEGDLVDGISTIIPVGTEGYYYNADGNETIVEGDNLEDTKAKINALYNAELAAVYDRYDKLITPLLQQPTQQPTIEEEVEETVVDRQAKEFLENTPDVTEENITTILDSVNAKEGSEERIPDEVITQIGFTSREDAANTLTRALEIFKENAKQTKTITLPNGQKIIVDKNTKDSNDINDDEEDYSLPALETPIDGEKGKTYLDKINEEIEDFVIRGIDQSTQESLLTYLAADIMQQAIDAKEATGKKELDTRPIFDKHLQSFKELAKFYKENGLPNKAKRLEAVIDQFDKVKRLTNQKISLFTTGTVQEELNLDDNESSVGLEKVIYSDDWAFTVSSKSTASADLKKFFAFVQDQDDNGPITNMLGFPEVLSFDTVYDTLHEILANKPADFEFMINTLELYTEKFPWISGVIEKIENASEKIQNEFVSDMAKHHIDMQFVMWSKDKNGQYSLQRWSSNASAIEQRLRQIWKSNLKGVTGKSNVVTVDSEGNYLFDKAEVARLVEQAAQFATNPDAVTNDDLANWLGALGIVLTNDTYKDLRDGKFNNRGKKPWKALFINSDGLIKTLAKELKSFSDGDILVEDADLLNDSVVKALAKLDAMNNMNTFSNSFQAGGKTVYSYGNNNFLVNRMRDLVAYNEAENKFINQELIEGLKNISFTKNSLWLNELTAQDELGNFTRNTLNVGYLSLEALKKKYTRSQDNRKLNNLTTAEHEVTKIGLFQNRSGKIFNGQTRRVVDFFYPTMSDKSTMLTLRALSYEYKLTDGEISDENLELLFTSIVEPELNRIRDKQANNIKGYEPNYFFLLPGLNTLNVSINNVEKTYLDLAKDKDDAVYSKEAKEAVKNHIKEVFTQLVDSKIQDWTKLNIGQTVKDSSGKIIEQYSFLDKEYMKYVAQGKLDYAAGDYVFNYLISNAEAIKLFAGDPALYGKFNSNNTLEQNLQETFINMGKRLAGDIAPGLELANSSNNTYYQVFLKDKKLDSNNLKDEVQKEFFTKIIDTYGKDYGAIEGSDAQEYTTWQEHLFVMKQLGRLTDTQFEAIDKKLTAQSIEGPKRANKLSFDEMQLVLQPTKPVYVGNSLDQSNNVDKRVYVKSSSFPLIPELTVGFQIEKIRKALEEFQANKKEEFGPDGQPLFVRASFGTANKVGAVKNTATVFDDNGNVVDGFTIEDSNALILERKNFRIQQDVPYKRKESSVNIGTQARTLLFADLLDLNIEPGVTGQDLLDSYQQDYEELFVYSQEKLAKRLGITEEVTTGEDLGPLTIIPETNLVSEVETFNEELKKTKSPVAKIQKQEEFADKIGKDNLERINFINKNFDNIIKALTEGKVNIFFDENDQFKKCD